jgi:hypothetical protein
MIQVVVIKILAESCVLLGTGADVVERSPVAILLTHVSASPASARLCVLPPNARQDLSYELPFVPQ